MADFSFDPDLSPEENIELFFNHLEQRDLEMTQLLRDNIEKLLPLPSGQGRRAAREAFNRAIREALTAPKSGAKEST
jgi:hypothetical protein